MAVVGYTHRFALGFAGNPLGDFFVVFEKVVQMGVDVCGLAADGTHGVAVVAVVEEDGGVFLERFELRGCAGALAVVVYTFPDGEVLVFAADNGTESHCGDNYDILASRCEYVEISNVP